MTHSCPVCTVLQLKKPNGPLLICPDKQKILICALSASCHVIVNTKGIWFSNSVSLHLAYCNSWSALLCVVILKKCQHILWYLDTNKILQIQSWTLNTVSRYRFVPRVTVCFIDLNTFEVYLDTYATLKMC